MASRLSDKSSSTLQLKREKYRTKKKKRVNMEHKKFVCFHYPPLLYGSARPLENMMLLPNF